MIRLEIRIKVNTIYLNFYYNQLFFLLILLVEIVQTTSNIQIVSTESIVSSTDATSTSSFPSTFTSSYHEQNKELKVKIDTLEKRILSLEKKYLDNDNEQTTASSSTEAAKNDLGDGDNMENFKVG